MSDDHSADIAVIKMQIAEHDNQFKRQWSEIHGQGITLATISNTLMQLKYMLIGAALFWLLNTFGFFQTIKLLIS